MSPLLLVGALAALGGIALFLGVMFSSGGVAKSEQFRVIGELFAGRHGATRRLLMIVSIPVVLVGMVLSFAGVAAADAARRRACEAHCRARGNQSGRLGPSQASEPGKAPVMVCHCEGGAGLPVEVQLSELEP